MKKVKFLKIKSFLLTMLVLLSLSTTISAASENVEAADADVHDINCKFNCEHINNSLVSPASNEVPLISEEEMIDLIAQTNNLSEEEAREIIVGVSEEPISAASENAESTDADVHDINCKFNCEHINNPLVSPVSNEIPLISEEEMIDLIAQTNNLSEEEAREIIVGVSEGVDYEIQSLSSCAHFMGPHTCGSQISQGNCIVTCYGTTSCILCGLSLPQIQEHESHIWTNGGVCGKQCTGCGRVVYNPGHGPGSGHSWCTND